MPPLYSKRWSFQCSHCSTRNPSSPCLQSEVSTMALAQSIRSTKGGYSYPHHILAKIGIQKLKTLLSTPDAPGADSAIEQEIKTVEQVLAEGLQQYPGDSYLLAADADLAELLKDAKRVTDSLQQAF